MMKPSEQVGAVPQPGVNPQARQNKQTPQDQLNQYGLTADDLDYFRHDPEIIAVVRQFTGRDFPMEQIDDALIIEIAGAVQKLGVEGAIAEANRIIPQELKSQIRGISMKQRLPRLPREGM